MIDLKKMLDAGVHFGHKTSRWSPKMRPFIWGAKNRVHLIDVSKTAILLERAGKFLKDAAGTNGKFLFVGTKKPAQAIIQRVATSLQMPYVIHRWVGGTLSNYDQVKKAVTRLLHMRDILQKSSEHYKKKELSMMQKEVARLEKNVGGIIDFDYPPSAIVVVDVKKESSAVREASRLGIPVVALVDTNTDPEGVSFIIPSNDDSPKAIEFVMNYLHDCAQEGVKESEAIKAKLRAEQLETRKAAVAKQAADRQATLVAQQAKAAEVKAAIAARTASQAPKEKPVVAPEKTVKAETPATEVKHHEVKHHKETAPVSKPKVAKAADHAEEAKSKAPKSDKKEVKEVAEKKPSSKKE